MKEIDVEVRFWSNPHFVTIRINDGAFIRSHDEKRVCFSNNPQYHSVGDARPTEKLIGDALKDLRVTSVGNTLPCIEKVSFNSGGIYVKKFDTSSWSDVGPLLVETLGGCVIASTKNSTRVSSLVGVD
ncbi:MAG: hypothetical protein KBB75_00840 [Candidatus Pacebacteria bacterium]|nr:hypothetical protein [Candidatus Paceibacterota bacterium]